MRVLSLSSRGGDLVLDGSAGVKARLEVRGMGMPDVSLQWFDGAGDGSSFRGGRTLPRTIDMPVKVYGADRAEVLTRYSRLARIMSLDNAPVTLTSDYDGQQWRLDVVRTGGGDFTHGQDTDGSTFVMTTITVQAGDPFFERVDGEGRKIAPAGIGLGLLGPGQSLVQLILSSTDGFGDVSFNNSGDVDAWPTWTFYAPFDGFAISRDGLGLGWTGTTRKTTGSITVNTREGTVVDETGANRYGELDPAPKFFPVPVGSSTGSVVMANAAGDAHADVVWRPRKLVLF